MCGSLAGDPQRDDVLAAGDRALLHEARQPQTRQPRREPDQRDRCQYGSVRAARKGQHVPESNQADRGDGRCQRAERVEPSGQPDQKGRKYLSTGKPVDFMSIWKSN